MKQKTNLYAPILAGVILTLIAVSSLAVPFAKGLAGDLFLVETILRLLIFLLPLAFYCRVRSVNPVSSLQLRSFSLKKLPFLAVLCAILFAGILLLRYAGLFLFEESAFLDTPSAMPYFSDGSKSLLSVLSSAVLPAVLEELLFHGILLEEYRPYGPLQAVVMTSLLYAMIHLSFANFAYYLFVGASLGVICVSAGSVIPGLVIHVLLNLSALYVSPSVIEYLRQAGKSMLLPYLLIALFLLLFVLLFARLENIYRDRAYDEMLQSRKELLREELERVRDLGDEKEKSKKISFFETVKELYLSPTFLLTCALFVALTLGLF